MTPTACPALLQLTSILLLPLAQTAPPAATETPPPPKTDWKQLLADHTAYGLPPGPEDGWPAIWTDDSDETLYNGERRFPRSLVFAQVVGEGQPAATTCFTGFTSFQAAKPENISTLAPDVYSARVSELDSELTTHSQSMVLAIYAYRRGMTELADELVKRAAKGEREALRFIRHTSVYSRDQFRGVDPPPQAMLAWVAWRHWFGKLNQPEVPLSEILPRLKLLLKDDFGLNTLTNRQWVLDIDETIRPVVKHDDPHEAMVDALIHWTDSEGDGLWEGRFSDSEPGAIEKDPLYGALWQAGFDAVPALRRHLADRRLTRAARVYINSMDDHGPKRICDLVTSLLDGLAAGQFEQNRRTVNGIVQLDESAVDEWWRGAAAKGERAYLLEHVLPPSRPPTWKSSFQVPQHVLEGNAQLAAHMKEMEAHAAEATKQSCEANSHLLHLIARKHPQELPALLRRAAAHCPDASNYLLVNLLMQAALPESTKVKALVDVAESGARGPMPSVIYALQEIGDERGSKYLLKEIEHLIVSAREDELRHQDYFLWKRAVLEGDAATMAKAIELARQAPVNLRCLLVGQLYCSEHPRAECGCTQPDRRLTVLSAFLDDHEIRQLGDLNRWKYGISHIAPDISDLPVRHMAALLIGTQLKLGVDWQAARQYNDADWTKLHARVADALGQQTPPK